MTRYHFVCTGAVLFLATFCFPLGSYARTPQAHQAQPGNVILLMLDGVRWQEVFYGVDPTLSQDEKGVVFPFLWNGLSNQGALFGDVLKGNSMTVGNPVNISLPGYQSIMAGMTQPCLNNDCGRISVETVQERLMRSTSPANLDKKKIATIASWQKIALAVEHVEGATFVNAGFQPVVDDEFDAEFEAINQAQKKDLPVWGEARFDRYTFAHAVHFLKKHQPRFLFISLNDSDEWGHKNDYPQYLTTLRQYDAWIRQLVDVLDGMGDYGRNTTLLVTTDHGRGSGQQWDSHGYIPEAKYVWLYGKAPGAQGARFLNQQNYTHLDLRPTIEAAAGVPPQTCAGCGGVIKEIVRQYDDARSNPIFAGGRAGGGVFPCKRPIIHLIGERRADILTPI
ncbi:alkaline phosphatase family protein [Bdellovibrionota bacterium FG-1]